MRAHPVSRAARIVPRVEPQKPLPPDRETLQGGPTRAPLLDRLTPALRHRGLILVAFALGVLSGSGAVWWWNDRPPEEPPAPSPPAAATSTEVRLVLGGRVIPPRPNARLGTGGAAPLRIDGVLLHGRGPGSATVTRIHRPGNSFAIRVPALPVRLSVNHSFERIRLQISPRDCRLATQWTPSAQPFTLTWKDDDGDVHVDIGGDHDASLEVILIRYLDAVCSDPGTR